VSTNDGLALGLVVQEAVNLSNAVDVSIVARRIVRELPTFG
jgi:hypothetical protein